MIANIPASDLLENRVLVLADGSSGPLADYAGRPGFRVCADITELCDEVERGVGTLLIPGERLESSSLDCLARTLRVQPEWSDIPVTVVLGRGQSAETAWRILRELGPVANVTIVENPGRPVCVLSAVEAGLKARRRQYELRHHLLVEERKDKALRRTRDALREADRRKENFMAMLAHELRNPLGPIRNAVHVLDIIGSNEAETCRVRGMIDRQVAHLSHLLDDLLDVSRLTSGRINLRRERIDMVPLVRAVVEDHRPDCETAGLTLIVSTPPQPLWVSGDATRLSQALANLIDNACKFTEPGGRISVTVAPGPGGDDVQVTVLDSGIGMDSATLASVFDTFTQGDCGLDRSGGGLGLGLALVRGLIELHDGGVEASSDGLGQGSRFTISLPTTPPPEVRTQSEVPAGDHNSLRILIIEDNLDAAESMGLLLRLAGHTVTLAHTGNDGLERARDFKPDVIICDIGLPGGMDGYEVARALRADPEVRGSYLVALTGYGQEEDQMRARLSGFDLHLTKPVDPVALKELLSNPLPAGRAESTLS